MSYNIKMQQKQQKKTKDMLNIHKKTETPLPGCLEIKAHILTRKKSILNILFSQLRYITNKLKNSICGQFESDRALSF